MADKEFQKEWGYPVHPSVVHMQPFYSVNEPQNMITLLKEEHVPSILAIIFHKSSMCGHRQVYHVFNLIIN